MEVDITIDKNKNSELGIQERAVISRVAKKIIDRGFVTPAVFFLELMKPFSLLGSHALVFFGPIITAFIRQDKYYRATELLEDPKNVEFLISEIERIDKENNNKSKEVRS
ncbi:MAG: hypothetical protein GWP19_13315 [Planctomycetia bacterium]|nr:hypothetical protein [Planctomycetia bacterium]